jgi:predicted nucleic acid-binding protein
LIVLDASAAIELVLRTACAERIAERALDPRERIHAPHLVDIEVLQVLRRLTQAREITMDRAQTALEDFQALVLDRHAHTPLIRRVWVLRTMLTAYDAAYVALAEALEAPLITCDRKLSRASGHAAQIEFIAMSS